MTARDRALLHRRWNPMPPSLCGRYIDVAACRLRFGCFEGYELTDVPDWYLLWALRTLKLSLSERTLLRYRLRMGRRGRSVFDHVDPRQWDHFDAVMGGLPQ